MPARGFVICLALCVLVPGCGGNGIAADELAPIVARDGVAFEGSSIPDDVVHFLAGYPVVVVGETHLIREQREFTAAVVEALHDHGYRQLLLEWPHMADWVMSDYVLGGDLAPGWWTPPTWLYGDLLEEIRDFNAGLPEGDRIDVRGIDVNLDEYGGATDFRDSLRGLVSGLGTSRPLTRFLEAAYDTPNAQIVALERVLADLAADRSSLVGAWGGHTFDVVQEMLEIELASVPVRATRDDEPEESAHLREELMKQLADARLRGYEYGSIVNVGGNHAQKERLKGTDQEWLGDYLVHTSSATDGPVICVVVVPGRVVAEYETEVPDWDLLDSSPDNELFRLMNETWPGQTVFLAFEDPLFQEGDIAMNFEDTIHVTTPERHYDAAVLLPMTHRIPLP